jgi:hypothetical protein
MNWRRGLLRAWFVAAICWIGVVGGHGVYKWYNDPWRIAWAKQIAKCNDGNPFTKYDPGCDKAKIDALPDAPLEPSLWVVLFLSIGPPAALLLLGTALYWVGQGFRSRAA